MADSSERRSDFDGDSLTREGNLSTRAMAAFKAGHYTDCSFIVGKNANMEKINAHKCILAFSSEVFATMLYGPLGRDTVQLPEDDPRIFKALLKMLYSDKKQCDLVDAQDVCLLWKTAHKYMITPICQELIENLIGRINTKNVPEIIDYAKLLGNEELEAMCWDAIDIGIQFDLDYLFDNLSLQVIEEMLERDTLVVRSEVMLLRGIERRCRMECKARLKEETHENLRQIGDKMIKKVRFLTMNFGYPVRSSLLTVDEIDSIHVNALDSMKINSSVKMPEGFCLYLRKRKHPLADLNQVWMRVSASPLLCRPTRDFPDFDFNFPNPADTASSYGW